MNRDDEEDKTIYKVVVNHEDKYSMLLAYQENPFGWKIQNRMLRLHQRTVDRHETA